MNDELDLYYRKILCASIEQAVLYAKGINLYTAAYGDNHRNKAEAARSTAIEYIFGQQFEMDMDLLDLENTVEAIRADVRKVLVCEQYQIPLAVYV